MDDAYRHYHNAFTHIILKQRQHLANKNFKLVIYDEYIENNERIKKMRKEFQNLDEYNTWLDEHYPSN